jgi:MerR family transcriptional regulator, light-induced transcriptional regulator
MSDATDLAGVIVKSAARALAGLATERLLQAVPGAQDAFPNAFHGWQELLASQLEDLAGTLAVDRPQLFLMQTRNQLQVSAARGLPPDQFRAALQALREVLANELSPPLAAAATASLDLALAGLAQEPASTASRLAPEDEHSRLTAQYLVAVLEGDRRRACRVLLDAAHGGHPVSDLYLRVLAPAQEEIGRLWTTVEANVAEEHFVSATTKLVMTQLLQVAPKKAAHGKSLLAAGVAGNRMDVGLHMLADLFEIDGWRVVQLGADVPVADLAQAVDFYEVDIAGLSVSQNVQLPALKQSITAIRSGPRGQQVKILLGGRTLSAAEDLASQLGADAYAADPVAALKIARQLTGLQE